MNEQQVLELIRAEREEQRVKHGIDRDKTHTPFVWVAIIADYLGRASNAAWRGDQDVFRRGLVKVAAICVAALENV